jgi:hypothetical protein
MGPQEEDAAPRKRSPAQKKRRPKKKRRPQKKATPGRGARGPSRVFGSIARSGRETADTPTLLGLAARPELLPAQVTPASVGRSRCAVGPRLGCAVFPERGSRDTFRYPRNTSPRVEPPSRVRPRNLASVPQHDRLLSWAFGPYSALGGGGPLITGFACPLRSALRVWPPSRRLSPSRTLPVLFHTGGALGIHPSELSPPGRYPRCFHRDRPTCRLPELLSPAVAGVGPLGAGFWASTLPGVPGTTARYERTAGWRLPWVLLCTGTLPLVRAQPPPGYVFTLQRAAHYCGRAVLFGGWSALSYGALPPGSPTGFPHWVPP